MRWKEGRLKMPDSPALPKLIKRLTALHEEDRDRVLSELGPSHRALLQRMISDPRVSAPMQDAVQIDFARLPLSSWLAEALKANQGMSQRSWQSLRDHALALMEEHGSNAGTALVKYKDNRSLFGRLLDLGRRERAG
jgi:hypothetical protein